MEEDWHRDLEHWLEPYLQNLGNKTRRRMCPAYIAGLIGRAIARASSPWRPGQMHLAMTGCIISSVPASGTARRWKLRYGEKQMGWSVATRPG
jgi:hypothetical protein